MVTNAHSTLLYDIMTIQLPEVMFESNFMLIRTIALIQFSGSQIQIEMYSMASYRNPYGTLMTHQ